MSNATSFMLKNVSRTFLKVTLTDVSIELKPMEVSGPYKLEQKSEHVERLCRTGVLALWQVSAGVTPEAPTTSKPKSRTTRTNG